MNVFGIVERIKSPVEVILAAVSGKLDDPDAAACGFKLFLYSAFICKVVFPCADAQDPQCGNGSVRLQFFYLGCKRCGDRVSCFFSAKSDHLLSPPVRLFFTASYTAAHLESTSSTALKVSLLRSSARLLFFMSFVLI